jgi:hypothetical protein
MELRAVEMVSGFLCEFSVTGHSVSIHDDHRIPSPRPAAPDRTHHIESVALLSEDFDQIAIVVDWLDACRRGDLEALLELYAEGASLECRCDGARQDAGRTALEAYWRPRLEALSPTAFGLEEITPTPEGVTLDYLDYEGEPVRIFFIFAADGKILRTHCAPASRTSQQDISSLRDPAG